MGCPVCMAVETRYGEPCRDCSLDEQEAEYEIGQWNDGRSEMELEIGLIGAPIDSVAGDVV